MVLVRQATVDRHADGLRLDDLAVDDRLGYDLHDARPRAARQVDIDQAFVVRAGLFGRDEGVPTGLLAEPETHERLVLDRHGPTGGVGHLERDDGDFLRAALYDADGCRREAREKDVGRRARGRVGLAGTGEPEARHLDGPAAYGEDGLRVRAEAIAARDDDHLGGLAHLKRGAKPALGVGLQDDVLALTDGGVVFRLDRDEGTLEGLVASVVEHEALDRDGAAFVVGTVTAGQ